MKRVAVVLLNYNGKDLLRQFLPSVIQYSSEASIIVADNCSTDGSAAMLREEFPSIELISIPSNRGYCGGYNFALKQVVADYYVLLNSDVEVTPHWLNPVLDVLDKNPHVAAAQPKILAYHQKDTFEYAGAGGGFIDTLGYPFCRGRLFMHLEKDNGQFNDVQPIFWATGACLFIRSEVFHGMGGFDEDFFAHMEEIDLCWRIKRSGKEIYYVGQSHVFHVGGGTLSASNPRKTFYNFTNGLALLCQHLAPAQLVFKLPVRLALDWVAAAKFLTHSPKDAWAVARAHYHFWNKIGNVIRKRRKLKKRLRNFQVTLVYPHLVIVDYFLLGTRYFRNLRRF